MALLHLPSLGGPSWQSLHHTTRACVQGIRDANGADALPNASDLRHEESQEVVLLWTGRAMLQESNLPAEKWRATRLEPATSCMTGRRSNQLSYAAAN